MRYAGPRMLWQHPVFEPDPLVRWLPQSAGDLKFLSGQNFPKDSCSELLKQTRRSASVPAGDALRVPPDASTRARRRRNPQSGRPAPPDSRQENRFNARRSIGDFSARCDGFQLPNFYPEFPRPFDQMCQLRACGIARQTGNKGAPGRGRRRMKWSPTASSRHCLMINPCLMEQGISRTSMTLSAPTRLSVTVEFFIFFSVISG